ncbi:MAG: M14 family zinc carboxypeptidase [Candidatus Cyclobacteriaceae bacterium M3_2C_046]
MKAIIDQLFPDILIQKIEYNLFDQKHIIGSSRQERPVYGFKFGKGPFLLSLIAGCHADEPTGPRLLKKLVSFLSHKSLDDPIFEHYTWYIVPQVNPDGEKINQAWYAEDDPEYNLAMFLQYAKREKPGDDLEFGFPDQDHAALRPENQAVFNFWKTAKTPFQVHISLHGMAKAFGPWFLLDQNWIRQSADLQKKCSAATKSLGYHLFDVDRKGEKGFYRIAQGFCTRPDSKYMKQYFLDQGQPDMAQKFYPSSMESIRFLGGNCLTLVSEMPLFILPQVDHSNLWPHPDLVGWQQQFNEWRDQIISGQIKPAEVNKLALAKGIKAMSVDDQMQLQWRLFSAGVETILAH